MLIFLTIYTTVLSGERWAWRDGIIKYELIINMARKEQCDWLHTIICALIHQGQTKHILTENEGKQPLSASAILAHLSGCKYTK